jgi:small subunit ribosomal protein S20
MFVAHSLSAQKRIRQTAKRRDRNRLRKKALRAQHRKLVTTLTGTDKTASAAEITKTIAMTDRIASKGTIHPNTAARRKSKLAKKLNALASAAAPVETPAPKAKAKAKAKA